MIPVQPVAGVIQVQPAVPARQPIRGRNPNAQITRAQGNIAQTQPMRKPRIIRISKQERDRRFANNLCLGCGEAGHFARDCPDEQEEPTETEREVGRAAFSIEEEQGSNDSFFMLDSEGTIMELQEEDSGNEMGVQDLEETEN
ncbi:hypothetical protein D9758_018558 [Tetrapyrgos nigripes]|uniref:CCHC-type domain-containing protein n=1 Tax=Tetrapyrgos nigripes TaxID=182062 RepID=A0A8H5BT12_9AGAR|nr:hypothetical protein D9758_018558 [Tetrapyrgos nigripes]